MIRKDGCQSGADYSGGTVGYRDWPDCGIEALDEKE